MMMIPRRNHFDLWDEMFKDPFFTEDNSTRLMRTDIKEKKDSYILDIDLPGYEKENIKLSIEDEYLTVEASKDTHTEEKREEGKYVRKERYVGKCSRSFYIGENIKPEEVKASFKNGTLSIEVPKKDITKELPEASKYIQIED